jgi:hypothetical protein
LGAENKLLRMLDSITKLPYYILTVTKQPRKTNMKNKISVTRFADAHDDNMNVISSPNMFQIVFGGQKIVFDTQADLDDAIADLANSITLGMIDDPKTKPRIVHLNKMLTKVLAD